MLVHPSDPTPDTCVICFEIYTKETSVHFQCLHQICIVCYEKLINQHNTVHCPLCREIVEIIQTQHEIIEPRHPVYNWCSLYCKELICYILILGGFSFCFIK